MKILNNIALFVVLAICVPLGAKAQESASELPDETTMPVESAVEPPSEEVPDTVPVSRTESESQTVAALPNPAAMDATNALLDQEMNEKLNYLKPNIVVNSMPSLFMTVWEHDLVKDARRGLVTRDPVQDDGIVATGPRDIVLGGIVFESTKDWTIWLNSMRISPTAIPDPVMDLKVFKDYIELEWYDENTNQIFPIRLRPHQRFNLDTRMFLPGGQ